MFMNKHLFIMLDPNNLLFVEQLYGRQVLSDVNAVDLFVKKINLKNTDDSTRFTRLR